MLLLQTRNAMLLLLACGLSIPSANAEYASHRDIEPPNLKQTYIKKTEYSDCEQLFPSQNRGEAKYPLFSLLKVRTNYETCACNITDWS